MNLWEDWREEKERRRKRHEHKYHYEPRDESILNLNRRIYTAKSTIGELLLDNEFQCNTLEDTVRDPNKDGKLSKDEKVYGKTAIPAGKYEVVISYSNKFKKKLPLLLNVPHYKGIRIHPGNTELDSLGCILVGKYDPEVPDFVGASRAAFNDLMPKLEKVIGMRKLYIEINGGPSA